MDTRAMLTHQTIDQKYRTDAGVDNPAGIGLVTSTSHNVTFFTFSFKMFMEETLSIQ